MKAMALLVVLIITGIFTIPRSDKDISGTWLVKQGDSRLYPPVLRIRMGEGIWEGRIDIPEQEVYDRRVNSIRVKGDSVFIRLYENGPLIAAKMMNDSTIKGSRTQEGRVDNVELKKK